MSGDLLATGQTLVIKIMAVLYFQNVFYPLATR